ncbi:MAG: hypothetical protein FWC93_05300 [Defluviitaleaceae bacterium]|nr:hypothetical protein [Defluviitaleaceae bacterium]
MLKNRSVAWAVAAVVMVAAVFFGAWGSYGGMRGAAQDAFDNEIMPRVRDASSQAFYMQRVAENYLSDSEISVIGIERIVLDIQDANDVGVIYGLFVELNRAVWAVYDRLEDVEMDEHNRGRAINFHANFLEQDDIMARAGYNNIAGEFNAALGGNLGFLVRMLVDEMPRFD